LISRYRASGVGVERFARENGLSPGRLHYWVYQKFRGSIKGRRPKGSRVVPGPVFQEVKLSANAAVTENWAAEVIWAGGVSIRFSAAAPPAWIGAVLGALLRPC
jgi:hypothetical protein